MIGIVLVSHSAGLAEGVRELAQEMAGPEVAITACGGLDLPGQPLGTDPTRIANAIQKMLIGHSPALDGILVLMDLGSALLSAEMALEFLPPELKGKVRLCSAPLVEGAVSAAVQARLGCTLEQVAVEARRSLEPKISQLDPQKETTEFFRNPIPESSSRKSLDEGNLLEINLTVTNRLGLHARPAARLVQLAAGYPGVTILITNLSRGTGPANACSINALAILGARRGHTLKVEAFGAGAAEALHAVEHFCQDGFGDEDTDLPEPDPGILQQNCFHKSTDQVLQGLAVSPGIAIGLARLIKISLPPVPTYKINDAQAEWRKLETALALVRSRIMLDKEAAERRSGNAIAAIFDAHLLMLEDETLIKPVRQGIFENQHNAARAWQNSLQHLLSMYQSLEDPYQRLRAVDLEDVGAQVLLGLLGEKSRTISLKDSGVLVLSDLTPADAAHIDPTLVQGIATVYGSLMSHSAVLVRALGIPMAAGLGEDLLSVSEGALVIVNGSNGQVFLHPEPQLVEEFTRQREVIRGAQAQALAASSVPAVTMDGYRIEIAANIGSAAGARAAVSAGADSVGLFRSEFLFLDRQEGPDEEEQVKAYRQAAEILRGRPLTIRTLDAGGDKPLPYLNLATEANPFLGWRAMRICLDQPEFFKIQLRAILRVAIDFPIKIMFPMIATLQEWRRGRELVQVARGELMERGFLVPDKVDTGMMVEIPSAALKAEQFAPEVDFFSIGTNDLTQYTLAAERGNPRLAQLSDHYHPAVLQLIEHVVLAAHAEHKWVGVCGEMAGEPLAVPLLLGLGVDELSMNPPAIPRVKQILRSISHNKAQEIAKRALAFESAQQVREFLEQHFIAQAERNQ